MEIHSVKDERPLIFKLRDMLLIDARFYSIVAAILGDNHIWGASLRFKSGGDLRLYFENEHHWAHTRDRIDRFQSGRPQREGATGIIEIAEGAVHWAISPDAKRAG